MRQTLGNGFSANSLLLCNASLAKRLISTELTSDAALSQSGQSCNLAKCQHNVRRALYAHWILWIDTSKANTVPHRYFLLSRMDMALEVKIQVAELYKRNRF